MIEKESKFIYVWKVFLENIENRFYLNFNGNK